MTNDEHKVVFIHFVKTGGSSIEDYFGGGDGYRETMFNFKDGKQKIVKEQHHFSSHQYLQTNGIDVWNECFKFSFVRNPWDWFLSCFFWDIKVYRDNEKKGYPQRYLEVVPLFPRWKEEHPQKYRRRFIVNECNSDFKTYVEKGMARPDWFKFPIMRDYTQGVDFIGRFENLQDDFNKVCRQIGTPIKKLAHLKKPESRPHYSHFYNEKTTDSVYNLLKADIEHFGYEFERK